ncbi:MAG TPA: 50S ribosomal protein L1 [bacterium]|nr:50S ribosomal protein L1 [bacterium]
MAGKKYAEAKTKVDREAEYALADSVKLVREAAYAGFDETVDLAFRLGVDPRHADQMVRGSVVLPHGTGKAVRVLVLTKGEKVREAEEAGADHAGLEDYLKKIEKDNWLEFDRVVATPDVMKDVARLGKLLGPRGLMPSPKTGTVTFDVGKAVADIKRGKVDYRVDKLGNVHMTVGRLSFTDEQLTANAATAVEAVVKARPAAAKGQYLRKLTISSTMGPGIRVSKQEALALAGG